MGDDRSASRGVLARGAGGSEFTRGAGVVRDPELVSRAQRAANELERAWSQWRLGRGVAEELSESVAGYVAHSIDYPWGRPRVVLGLDADEARALAALLGKTDPVRAEHVHSGQAHLTNACRDADCQGP